MKGGRSPYAGYRFPPEIIRYAVWANHRFCLSFRDVEDLLAERGILVSYTRPYNSCNLPGTTSSNVEVDQPGRILAEDQTGRKTQSHRGVIGPLPRREAKWAAADNIGNRRERTRRLKFERGSECVSDSKSEMVSAIALDDLQWKGFYLTLFSDATESLGLEGLTSKSPTRTL